MIDHQDGSISNCKSNSNGSITSPNLCAYNMNRRDQYSHITDDEQSKSILKVERRESHEDALNNNNQPVDLSRWRSGGRDANHTVVSSLMNPARGIQELIESTLKLNTCSHYPQSNCMCNNNNNNNNNSLDVFNCNVTTSSSAGDGLLGSKCSKRRRMKNL